MAGIAVAVLWVVSVASGKAVAGLVGAWRVRPLDCLLDVSAVYVWCSRRVYQLKTSTSAAPYQGWWVVCDQHSLNLNARQLNRSWCIAALVVLLYMLLLQKVSGRQRLVVVLKVVESTWEIIRRCKVVVMGCCKTAVMPLLPGCSYTGHSSRSC